MIVIVGSAPFVGWTKGLNPRFEIKKKKEKKKQIKKSEEVSKDVVPKKRKKMGRGFWEREIKGLGF